MSDNNLPRSRSPAAIRQLLKSASMLEQWEVGEEDRIEAAESIRRMTATISVKRKYRYKRDVLGGTM